MFRLMNKEIDETRLVYQGCIVRLHIESGQHSASNHSTDSEFLRLLINGVE